MEGRRGEEEKSGEGFTFGMPKLELDQDPGCEEAEDAEEDDEDYAWDEADNCKGGGEGEHAVTDDFGDHEDGNEFP